MTRHVTTLTLSLLVVALLTLDARAQRTEFELNLPNSEDIMAGYATGEQSGARDIAGPFDLDGDGQYEILVSDYTGGGRVHVIENRGADLWELVYSTPWMDSTGTTNNIRAIAGGDLDGDGMGEIFFLGGRGFSEFNPNLSDFPPGLYVFEYTGTDDDYGTAPASIYEFDGDLPDRWRAEQMDVADVDGDGDQELFFGNNGADGVYDNWYVLSVDGDLGDPFATWVQELRLSTRSDEFDPTARGGGSPYAIHPADLNGDGVYELSLHSWNSFNLTNVGTNGDGTYNVPDSTFANYFLQATAPDDQVSFFGGVVVDIDGNGDDEVFYPNLQTGNVAILNYEDSEDVLQVTADNIVLDVIEGFSTLGITAGDLDGDGNMELIGTAIGYSDSLFNAGVSAEWFRIVEYNGGDPEDPNSYTPVETVSFSDDDYDSFHTINRLDGSVERTDSPMNVSDTLDVVVEDGTNPEFASKFAYLGDADMDGMNEVAFGIQGVFDILYTVDEVAADSFTIASSAFPSEVQVSNENRIFMRVASRGGLAVNVTDERIVLPSEYKLHPNFPNPFNPSTTISFTLPLEKAISVRIYDVSGRVVRTLVNNEIYQKGTFDVVWDGTGDAGNPVASGTYLYALEYGNFRQSRTLTLIK